MGFSLGLLPEISHLNGSGTTLEVDPCELGEKNLWIDLELIKGSLLWSDLIDSISSWLGKEGMWSLEISSFFITRRSFVEFWILKPLLSRTAMVGLWAAEVKKLAGAEDRRTWSWVWVAISLFRFMFECSTEIAFLFFPFFRPHEPNKNAKHPGCLFDINLR